MREFESWFRRSTGGLNDLAQKIDSERFSLEREGLALLFKNLEKASGNDGVEISTRFWDFQSASFQNLPLLDKYLVTFEYSHGRKEHSWSLEAHDSAKFLIKPWGRSWLSETAVFVRKPFDWNGTFYPEIEIQSDQRAIKKFYPFDNSDVGEDWSSASTLDVLKFLNYVVNQRLKEEQRESAAGAIEQVG